MISESDMARDDMLRQFFLGFVKVHILHHAAEAPVYGLALIVELRRHGYELSPGTLYPVLHQLEEAGYLARLTRVVGGKVRKYYALTPRGGVALRGARAKIGELVEELLEADIARAGPTGPEAGRTPRPSRGHRAGGRRPRAARTATRARGRSAPRRRSPRGGVR
jgi:DNA-binding PadR family transcriptional regulator